MDDWSNEMQSGDNPCWQDLYDDDCSMESVYSASFVASKWIKSMPCGAGIEVRRLFIEGNVCSLFRVTPSWFFSLALGL